MKRIQLILIILLILTAHLGFTADSERGKLKFGFSERFRFVAWDNSINLDDDNEDAFAFTRHRTSLQLQWLARSNLELTVKWTHEFRVYLNPKEREFNIDEIFFDQLYLKWSHPGKLPVTLTLGRQNIMLGEGFIVMDGQPLTGSRSIYFNAARLDLDFSDRHRLTAFFSYVPERDDILPIINNRDQPLEEQSHTGIGIYYSGKLNKVGLEAYYIRKDTEANSSRPLESGIDTLGSRWSLPLAKKLSLTAELALQTGSMGEFHRSALGGYFHCDYRFADSMPILDTITLGGIYLSGDDPSTGKMEGWDPVFSRWPKWSESYIYTLIREQGVAYWSNLNTIYLSLLSRLTRDITLQLSYFKLRAHRAAAPEFPGGDGKERGDLLIAWLKFDITRNLKGHFLWEHFKPGGFYFPGADGYHWLRFELMLRF